MRIASDDSPDGAVAGADAGAAGPERRCILSGSHGQRDDLIRLVIGPDGVVWPDLAAKLPGRGAWVTADHGLVATAVANGKLRSALARAFRARPPLVPADLADRIAEGLGQRALKRLGLEMRAGHLIWGSDRLTEWARAGRLHLLLHAHDAAADGCGKLDQAFRAGGGTMQQVMTLPVDRLALSSALGRDNMVHVGIADPRAARRVESDVARWSAFLRMPRTDGNGGEHLPLLPAAMDRFPGGTDRNERDLPVPDHDGGQASAENDATCRQSAADVEDEGRE